MKDGSSLVVTPSSIPSSATRGSDADLSSEGSEDILENPDDKPTMKKKIFDFKKEESTEHEAEFMSMCLFILLSVLLLSFPLFVLLSHFYTYIYIYIYLCVNFCCGLPPFCMSIPLFTETFEELGVAADTDMPTVISPATPIVPVSTIFSALVFAVPTASVSVTPIAPVPAISTVSTLMSLGVFLFLIFFFTSSLFVPFSSWFLTPCFMSS